MCFKQSSMISFFLSKQTKKVSEQFVPCVEVSSKSVCSLLYEVELLLFRCTLWTLTLENPTSFGVSFHFPSSFGHKVSFITAYPGPRYILMLQSLWNIFMFLLFFWKIWQGQYKVVWSQISSKCIEDNDRSKCAYRGNASALRASRGRHNNRH